jgi:hypothetical protein
MPDPTDLVKDLPADFAIFGNAVDSTVKTNADAAIAKTIVDAKGDIIAATAADTVSRLAVGANDTVLTADSSTATGLKWAAASAGATNLLDGTLGTYRRFNANGTIDTSAAATLDATFYQPVYLPAGTVDRIAIRTGAGGSYTGTQAVRLGIYNQSNGRPTTVLVDAGTVAPAANATNYEITISQAVTAGWYFIATNLQDDGGDSPKFVTMGSATVIYDYTGTQANPNSNSTLTGCYRQTGVSGAFATAGTLTNATGDNQIIGVVRVS